MCPPYLRNKISGSAVFIGLNILLASTPAYSAGFSVAEQGAAALGIAGAATARHDLAEAGFYNPAAWAFAERLMLAAGISAIDASIAHVDPATDTRTDATTDIQTPPYFHAGVRFFDFAAGLSFDVPFGSGLAWPADWNGRFDVTSIELQVFEFAGTLAWRPHRRLAIAAGPRVARATVKYARQIDALDTEGAVSLAGDATGVGAQFAVLYQATDQLTLGLNFRSRMRLDFDGHAQFRQIPVELQQKAHDQAVSTSLTLPDRISAGAAWQLGPGIASLDFTYWTWSTFKTFGIQFADPDTPDVAQPRDWHDAITIAAGWEQHNLLPDLVLRTGINFDQTPSPTTTLSPSLPDGSRLTPTIGAGYQIIDNLQLNLAYAHTFFLGAHTDPTTPESAQTTQTPFPADYKASAHIASLGLNYVY